jgi:hypothetical protein
MRTKIAAVLLSATAVGGVAAALAPAAASAATVTVASAGHVKPAICYEG